MTLTVGELIVAFKRMPPRAAQIIERAALDGLRLGQLARHYGVTEQAAGVLLMRSVRALDAALSEHSVAALPFEAELAALPEFLEGWTRGSPVGPAATLVASAVMRDELKVALARAAAAEAARPGRRHEGWLRWVAIALIVALSVYLYWRDVAR